MSITKFPGGAELQKALLTLAPKLERNAMRGTLRAGLKPIQVDAKANANKDTGEMAAGLKVSTRAKGGLVTASLKATGKHRSLAHWQEFGTNPHLIKAPPGSALNINGVFVKEVRHPGTAPKPFMRPALDSKVGAAVAASANYLKQRLATKHGIDTSHIEIVE
jgi:HK97 gp10 family phage protein